MTPWAALAIFAAGLAAGTINVIVGSGSLITFPTLLALGYPPVLANVSNNVGLVPGQRQRGGGLPPRARRPAVPAGHARRGVAVRRDHRCGPAPGPALQRVQGGHPGAGPPGRRADGRPAPGQRVAGRTGRAPASTAAPLLLVGVFLTGVYGGLLRRRPGGHPHQPAGHLHRRRPPAAQRHQERAGPARQRGGRRRVRPFPHVSWSVAGLIALGSTIGGQLGGHYGRRLPTAVLRACIVVVGSACRSSCSWSGTDPGGSPGAPSMPSGPSEPPGSVGGCPTRSPPPWPRVAAGLPGGGESRPGQVEMAAAVADALAGAGTSSSRPAPAPASRSPTWCPPPCPASRVVVATATKALQDQLADKDLPQVAAATDHGLTFAVLKGRSNYVCRQRVSEVAGDGRPAHPDRRIGRPARRRRQPHPGGRHGHVRPGDRRRPGAEPGPLGRATPITGDRAELPFEPHFRAWAMVSTTARECPGAFRCPSGRDCFAEDARARAADADVVVVNTHLYGAHLASGGAVLPEHQVVVFDEAHEVEDVMTDSLGLEVGPGRFRALATAARPVLGRRRRRVAGRRGRRRPGRRVPPGAPAVVGTPGAPRRTSPRAPTPTGPRPHPDRRPSRRPTTTSRPGSTSDSPRSRAPRTSEAAAAPSAAGTGRRPRPSAAIPTSPPCWPSPPGGSAAWSTICAGPSATPAMRETSGERSRRDRVLLAAGHLAADLARLALAGGRRGGLGGGRQPGSGPAGLPHRRRPRPGRAALGPRHRPC